MKKNNFTLSYQQITELIPDLVMFINPKGEIIEVSEEIKDQIGYPKKEIIGKNILKLPFLTKESRSKIKKNFAKRLSGKMVSPYRIDFITKDKKIKIGRISGTTVKDEKNEIKGILVTITNINQLEKDRKDELNKFLDNMPSGVAIYKPVKKGRDFIFEFYNSAGEKIDGKSKNEVINKKITEVFPGVKEMGLLDILTKVYKTGQTINFPATKYKDNKLESWRDNLVFKLPNENIAVIYQDITNLKATEQKSLLFFQAFVSSPISGVVAQYKDKKASILYVNKAFFDFYGYTKKEAIGKEPNILNSGKQNEDFYKKMWSEILDPKIGKWSGEIINKKKNGDLINVILSINTIFNDKEEPTYFAANHINITDIKENQKQLQERFEELEKFNKLMVGRELKMIELKEEIKSLQNKTK